MSKQSLQIEEVQERCDSIKSALEFEWPTGSNDSEREIFVSAWEALGMAPTDAIGLAQDPLTLYLALLLPGVGLEAILADRYATAGLKQCLIENHSGVRRALISYSEASRPKGKPGPRPRKGGYLTDQALRLRESGKTLGQIALQLWNDPEKSNRASALIAQAKKRGAAKKPKA
jgi:hypothetical protein